MNILLIFPNIYTPLSFSPAIQTLSAVLKKAGHKINLIHIHKDIIPDDPKKIIKEIKKIKPDIIGFTSTSFEYQRVNELAGEIKKEIKTPIMLGGCHATISSEDYETSNFDSFIIGEGEEILLSIAQGEIKPEGIIQGRIIKDLNKLPFYDWEIMDSQKIIASKNGWINIGFSRGCPFNCTFCIGPLLRKIHGVKYIRKMKVDRCIEELKYIISKFNIKVINFDDDLFTVNKKWLFEFLKPYKEEIFDKHKIKFVIESRVDTINEEVIKKLKESGCLEIQFGVETGSERLREFLKKGASNEKIIKAFKLCKKYGINTYTFMIMGIPTETENDIKETMKFLSIIKPDLIRPTFACPVKGTELYEYCVNDNLIGKNVTVWNYESPLKLKTIDNPTLFKYWILYPWLINANMGYKEYGEKIDEFFKKDYETIKTIDSFKDLLKIDKNLSETLTKKGLEHYNYQGEMDEKEDRNFRFNRFKLIKP